MRPPAEPAPLVPLQIPDLPVLLFMLLAFGLQLLVPAFVALVVYQLVDGRNAYEERIRELEAEATSASATRR